ncbi:hypothetical protein [Saccharicrinis sp. FJH54]|uniref:hypothetical protein n=1 Tax=Saccharicrinis sp. FJH54 TaxID=3344665 RepID=UPI0035D4C1BE
MKSVFLIAIVIVLTTSCISNRYMLNDNGHKSTALISAIKEAKTNGQKIHKPLIVLDGIPYRYDVELKQSRLPVRPDDIARMSVLKENMGASIYGETGKGGVILITTKQAAVITKRKEVRINCTQPVKQDKLLYLRDGKIISQAEMNVIDASNIESVDVIKDPDEIKKYTTEDYDGVIVIRMKQSD